MRLLLIEKNERETHPGKSGARITAGRNCIRDKAGGATWERRGYVASDAENRADYCAWFHRSTFEASRCANSQVTVRDRTAKPHQIPLLIDSLAFTRQVAWCAVKEIPNFKMQFSLISLYINHLWSTCHRPCTMLSPVPHTNLIQMVSLEGDACYSPYM